MMGIVCADGSSEPALGRLRRRLGSCRVRVRFTPVEGGVMRFRLMLILAACLSLLLVAVVGIALAAKPKPGYTYSTPSTVSPSVYFKALSKRRLTDFSAGLALKCKSSCGGFGGIRSFTLMSVKVSKKGKFKVSGNILAVNNKKLGTETVTGRFVSATEVKGKVTTHANLGQYEGVTKSYTATATPPTT
jgi:hypothetical protein